MKHKTAILQREIGTTRFQFSKVMRAKAALRTVLEKKDTSIINLQERLQNRDHAVEDTRNWIKQKDDKIHDLGKELDDRRKEIYHLKGELEGRVTGVDSAMELL